MDKSITSDVVVADSQCRRKAFLLLRADAGARPHEYEEIIARRAAANRGTHVTAMQDADGAVNGSCPPDSLAEAPLISGHLRADCDLLERPTNGSNDGRQPCQPQLVTGTYSVTDDDALRLAFAGHVTGQLGGARPEVGTVVTLGAQCRTVPLTPLYPAVAEAVDRLQSWLDDPPTDPPPVVLNKHCPTCPFRQDCTKRAEELDDLSLLDRMTPKLMAHYHKKGIFTVQQLSYQFKPRRRRKHSRHPPPVFKVEVQALALRTGKVYLHEPALVPRHSVELFLDIEGDPDRSLYYLFGLYVVEEGRSQYFGFWADGSVDEQRTLGNLCGKIAEFPDGPIYHYGSYEARALEVLSRRYDVDLAPIARRLSNVNSLVFGRVYFPVRSNGLKALAPYAGARWTQPEATGLTSLVWR